MSPSRSKAFAWAIALACAGLVFLAAAARADTTHPYLGSITIADGGGVEPEAVDDQGNLIVWLNEQHAVAKFDVNGNPVDFSGLGTHLIDGKGGGECPLVPSDCDQVPTNGFETRTHGAIGNFQGNNNTVAVDHSGGPADGYIYVQNNQYENGCCFPDPATNQIDVFNDRGVYVGMIDESQQAPSWAGLDQGADGLTVAADGAIYITHFCKCGTPIPPNVNRYLPVDGNPAHDRFAGQIYSKQGARNEFGSYYSFLNSAGGKNFVYTFGDDRAVQAQFGQSCCFWQKWPLTESHHTVLEDAPEPMVFPGAPGPFGPTSGFVPKPCSACGTQPGLRVIGIDPATEDVYIGNGEFGFQQWTEDNKRVGPMFGAAEIGDDFEVDTIAFDRSGGPNDGTIYLRGNGPDQIAVFGPPVVIPDIEYSTVEPRHDGARLSGIVDPAGGPPVIECTVEVGARAFVYGRSIPCEPPGEVSSEAAITAVVSGLPTEQDFHYRIVARNANGLNTGDDRVFHTTAVLGLRTEPPTSLETTSADLNGTLNPDGMETTYHFEWGPSTQYTESTPEELLPSPGTTEQAVPAVSVDGLQPGRTYHYRIIASNSLGTSYGADMSFVAPNRPAISGLSASNVTESSADLHARIETFGSDTTYRFEYGSTTQYGTSLDEESIAGTGSGPQAASGHVDTLQPGVTYHYRIVARNQWGITSSGDSTFSFLPPNCPNAHVRQQTGSNFLPDCRAYELVSPARAGGVTLLPGNITDDFGAERFRAPEPDWAFIAPNISGEATNPPRFGFFGVVGTVTGLDAPNTLGDRYVATRTDGGWITTYPGQTGSETPIVDRSQCSVSMDVCINYKPRDVASGSRIELPGSDAPYAWTVEGRSLGRWPTNVGVVPDGEHFVGDTKPSPDYSHFFFSSRDQRFSPEGRIEAPGSVYDNDIAEGTVVAVSRLNNGMSIEQEPSNVSDEDEYMRIPAASKDGSHVLMSTTAAPFCPRNVRHEECPPPPPVHLYLRVDDAVTYDVSKGHQVQLIGMTDGGNRVLFSTDEQLLDGDEDDSVDVYMWSEATDDLTLLSQGNGHGNSDGCNAGWTSACDAVVPRTGRPDLDDVFASGNGDVYFYSPEQLDPANPGVRNAQNLYSAGDGKITYVTTLDPGTSIDRMQIAPDDSHTAFLTRSQVTGYDNEGWEEMYTWDREGGEVRCASCVPSGEPPTVDRPIEIYQSHETTRDVEASESGPFMSNDGRVAFSTADALVPADSNEALDVYEFDGGVAHLISGGRIRRALWVGNLFFPNLYTGLESFSADGQDLYFSTFDTLVPQDENGEFVKFYDARSNGGFPVKASLLPCTAADECHGPSGEAPAPLQIGTSANLGKQATPSKRKRRRAAKRKRRRRHQQRGHRRRRSRKGHRKRARRASRRSGPSARGRRG